MRSGRQKLYQATQFKHLSLASFEYEPSSAIRQLLLRRAGFLILNLQIIRIPGVTVYGTSPRDNRAHGEVYPELLVALGLGFRLM